LIARQTAQSHSRPARTGESVIVTPIAARPTSLPASVAFCAARLPGPEHGNGSPVTASMADLHASLPPELEPAIRKRRVEFLAGRLCAREAARQLERPLHVVRRGPSGEPIWPTGLVGSIAHSHRIACAALADASDHRAIGIDIEPVCSAEDAERLAPMIFASGERAAIGPWPQGEEDLFTVIFSLKEAIYKCIYPKVRRFVDFQEIRLLKTGSSAFAVEVSQSLEDDLHDWRLQLEVDWMADHRFALCLAAPLPVVGPDGA
jgi:enterobactin synthetase component D